VWYLQTENSKVSGFVSDARYFERDPCVCL
jgi:hypothetical protein